MTLETTTCMGQCPSYLLTLYGDGRLDWDGGNFSGCPGHEERQIFPETVTAVIETFLAAQFFELDENTGELPSEPELVCPSVTPTCTYAAPRLTVCTDSSHAITTFHQNGRIRRLDDPHCGTTSLSRLENAVIALLGIERGWIVSGDDAASSTT